MARTVTPPSVRYRQLDDAQILETLSRLRNRINERFPFLITFESRLKRRRALETLHQLRSVAHIVDMHQLTKDPERIAAVRPDTASSPARALTPFDLGRYLDYCSELLAVISKLAALHVQHFNDPVTLAAVNDIECLTTGLSNKMWQKITLLDTFRAQAVSTTGARQR